MFFHKKRITHLTFITCLCFLFCVAGCSRMAKSEEAQDIVVEEAYMMEDSAVPMMTSAKSLAARSSNAAMEMSYEPQIQTASGASQSDAEAQKQERKLILSGSLNFEVDDLKETENSILSWCTGFGGYISQSQIDRNHLYVTAHIPSERFYDAIDASGEIGRLKDRNLYSEDVSESFYDLTTRLDNKKILRDRFQGYLKNAKDVKELLSIEKQLNDVLYDIDSMEGRLRRLSSQIDFSRITISASLPSHTTEEGFIFPEISENFRTFLSDVLFYFVGFFFMIFYLVIYGVPLVVLAAGIYWITFGKVGLVKKLFKKAAGKTTPPKKE